MQAEVKLSQGTKGTHIDREKKELLVACEPEDVDAGN